MKILLPVDGSEPSLQTLNWVIGSYSKNSEYYLLYVIKVLPELSVMDYELEDASGILETARKLLEGAGFQVARTEYTVGDPAERICHYAEEMGLDQIIIGSHGRSGLTRFLLGSTSIAVMEHCRKPVIVYRNFEPNPSRPFMMPGSAT